MRHLFIINKNAGKNKKNLPVLEKIEKQQGDNVVIRYTEKAQDATDIAREFVSESDEFVRVYACGGDCTVNEVLSGIYDLDNCALGVIPIGSGNDFIRSFDGEKEDFRDIERMMNGSEVEVFEP